MSCSGLFKVTVWKLAILALLLILNVALYAGSTYLFDKETRYSPAKSKDSDFVVQTNRTSRENLSQRLQNVTYNTTNLSHRLQIVTYKTTNLSRSLQYVTYNTTNLSHSLQNVTYNTTTHFFTTPVPTHTFLMEKIINPHIFEYVIRPNVTCSDREVELAICVLITRDNQVGRSVIRRTWGSYAKDPNNKAVLLFFVGSDNKVNETENMLVRQSEFQKEASIFGDIVQENYIDSYRNLSLKSVSILKWVNSFCPKTKYILKVDDDMYVNIPFLMSKLQEFVVKSSPPSAFIQGVLIADSGPFRHNSSKWYTPHSLYKEDKYPHFLSGTSYVMTGEAAMLLYQASLRVPLFWLEDVYITGLCARKAGVRVYGSKYFSNGKIRASGCSFKTMVSGHYYTHGEIVNIHTQLHDPNLKC